MGNVFGCIEEMPDLQRIEYDMTPLRTKQIPIIWLVGPPGSGRTSQAEAMAENLGFEVVRIAQLLRNESLKETERGKISKDCLTYNRKVTDTLVIDLIKEEMLAKVRNARGFILNGFPRSSKQALLFVKEIGNVDVIIYLYSNTNDMVQRIQQKRGGSANAELLRRDIISYMKETKEGTSKFSAKVEKIYSDAPIKEVYRKVEQALGMRINLEVLPSIQATSKITIKSSSDS